MSLATVAQRAIHTRDARASGIASADGSRFAHDVQGRQCRSAHLEVGTGSTRRARFRIPDETCCEEVELFADIPCLEGDDH